ncbi:MAG: DUF512 domain-containing protein [Oscillospiraceae bacterium]|nr:DUF512 domain-containing protein [Oscillospiraceae bacterium]
MSMTVIRSVDPGSPAQRAGIHPGETLIQVNGHAITDVLDYKFYTYDPRLVLTLSDGAERIRTVQLRKAAGEGLGLNFETYLMDKARSCANRCIFCFVDQMPPGLRDTLYFKDDDARLSFLMGNYITLTNLSERELQRIVDLRISPINISVHTTKPVLREQMLGNRRAGQCLEQMRRFAAAGITMNCQIVACPNLNDGAELDHTLTELSDLYPGVNSISVVPVGITRFRDSLYPLEAYTTESAEQVLIQVEQFSQRCLEQFGTRLVWCSDEFYLKAGRKLPSEDFYESFTQLENGVGMLTLLQSEFQAALSFEQCDTPSPFSIATGVAAAPHLTALLEMAKGAYPNLQGEVYPIVNHFFGETIDVAGLITGHDLIQQLEGKPLGERLLIPTNMLRHQEHVFLDDVTVEQVEEVLGVPLVPVEQDGGALFDAIFAPDTDLIGESYVMVSEDSAEYYDYNPPRKRKEGKP